MTSFRTSAALIGLASSILAIAHGLVGPTPALLAWDDIQVVLFPDTADGTLVVISQTLHTPRRDSGVQFAAFFDPDSVSAWIPRARAFLDMQIPATDTNNALASTPLVSPDGETMFLARRKGAGGWTSERYLGVRFRPGRPARYINLTPRAAGQFLDSLAEVVLRTPVFDSTNRRWEIGLLGRDEAVACPAALPGNKAPLYPVYERDRRADGDVWATFVVTERGGVDEKTIQIVYATTVSFARAVRDAVPRLRFDPAQRHGVAIPKRVVMPFSFHIMSPGEFWPAPDSTRRGTRCTP